LLEVAILNSHPNETYPIGWEKVLQTTEEDGVDIEQGETQRLNTSNSAFELKNENLKIPHKERDIDFVIVSL
jgi:hypothetical protein